MNGLLLTESNGYGLGILQIVVTTQRLKVLRYMCLVPLYGMISEKHQRRGVTSA